MYFSRDPYYLVSRSPLAKFFKTPRGEWSRLSHYLNWSDLSKIARIPNRRTPFPSPPAYPFSSKTNYSRYNQSSASNPTHSCLSCSPYTRWGVWAYVFWWQFSTWPEHWTPCLSASWAYRWIRRAPRLLRWGQNTAKLGCIRWLRWFWPAFG